MYFSTNSSTTVRETHEINTQLQTTNKYIFMFNFVMHKLTSHTQNGMMKSVMQAIEDILTTFANYDVCRDNTSPYSDYFTEER